MESNESPLIDYQLNLADSRACCRHFVARVFGAASILRAHAPAICGRHFVAKTVMSSFRHPRPPRRLGSDPPFGHWCLHKFERQKIGTPLPVNSDLQAKLRDRMLTEFAGRGAGGEGQ
jgi:hypothetical protein